MSADLDPLVLLRELDSRANALPIGLPEAGTGDPNRRYIGFRIDGVSLLASMAGVQEVLNYPDLSRVPGAKPWLRGIAHSRGRLMSVVDLRMFLCGQTTQVRRATRILLVERGDLLVGLMVDEVFGLRQGLDPLTPEPPDALPDWLSDYVSSSVHDDGVQWGVLELDPLLTNQDFLHAAA